MAASYDAFISYSHAKDKPLAAALQRVVQTLGKPWYRRRALRVFRDDASLSTTPQLWPAIERALRQSRFLIFLASPQSAASRWCSREVEFWLEHKSIDTLMIVLTEGDLHWDETAGDFAFTASTPLPAALKGRYKSEPKWADMRAFRAGVALRNAAFLDLAADIASAIHGVPQEDLLSEELAQQRRALTLAWSAAGSLLILAAVAAWQWKAAVDAKQLATQQRTLAESERDRAERALAAATRTANSLIVDLAREFRDRTGMPIDLVRKILDRARELQRQLTESGEITPDLRYSEAMALHELVSTYTDMGDTAAALGAARSYHAVIAALAETAPANTTWQQVLATAFTKLGDILTDAGHYAEALEATRASLAIWEKLAALDSDNAEFQWGLASSYDRLGVAAQAAEQQEEALDAYRKSLSIWEKLAAAAPGNSQWLLGVVTSHDRLGRMLIATGRAEEALDTLRQAFDVSRTLVASDPGNVQWHRDLSFSHLAVGDALVAAGRREEAVEAYQNCREILEKLAAADPANAGRQWDLFVADLALGDVLAALGRRDEALAALRRALAIAERLAGANAGNARWQSDLAVVLVKLARAGEDAEVRFGRALEIMRRLAAAGKLAPNQTGWIAAIEREKAGLAK